MKYLVFVLLFVPGFLLADDRDLYAGIHEQCVTKNENCLKLAIDCQRGVDLACAHNSVVQLNAGFYDAAKFSAQKGCAANGKVSCENLKRILASKHK